MRERICQSSNRHMNHELCGQKVPLTIQENNRYKITTFLSEQRNLK